MNKGIFDRTIFTQKDKDLLNLFYNLSTSSQFVQDNAPYILMRVNTQSLPNNVDSFTISTSAHPDDTIMYTASADVVNLDTKDGGFF